jgi:hypothetical protein
MPPRRHAGIVAASPLRLFVMTDHDRIEKLEKDLSHALGQICSLNIAVGALLKAHPDPAEAARLVDLSYEEAISSMLPRAMSDTFFDGMAFVRKNFLSLK